MGDIVLALGQDRIVTVLLLSARLAAVLLLTPVLHAAAMPPTVRVLIVLGLACAMALPFGSRSVPASQDVGWLVQAVLHEAVVGATLGLGILVAFAGFAVAGRLIDVQVGFGFAQVLDPVTRMQVPALSATFALFAAVVFFLVDGHHALLRGVAYSLERFPLGGAFDLSGAVHPVTRQVAALFALGFALAAPVVLVLLLVEFALGAVSRNLPQMNMLALGIPVKILARLLALSVWATGFGAPAGRLYAQIYHAWTGWFAAERDR